MPAKVLLLSSVGWPSVARLAFGFAHAGCMVDALAPGGAAIIASRYLARHHRYRALSPLSSMRAAIEVAVPQLVVCCDDRALAQLLALYGRRAQDNAFRALVETSLGNPSAIPRLISRYGFMEEARAEGIRVPLTLPIHHERDLDAAIAAVGFPLVLKSDGSWGGDGVIVVRNAADARTAFARLSRSPSRLRSLARAIRRRDAHFLHEIFGTSTHAVSAQRFIPGLPAASAFAAWRGEPIAAVYYDVLIAEGTQGPPSVIRRVDCPELIQATRKIARRFAISGIHGMDFIRDADGAAHLIEINPRATQGSTLAFGIGRDLPAALAGCLVPGAQARPGIANDLVAFFPREWKRDPLSPYLLSAHHDVPWDDPGVLLASLGVPANSLPPPDALAPKVAREYAETRNGATLGAQTESTSAIRR
ncbi:MAG TPA: hypothetical protein VHU23_06260 [Rhizomicrobium sp.]|jgi:hypothetical protein|nr:hypothetical protein [Rhizomicrobium sp.]